jgi:hypothetical protein
MQLSSVPGYLASKMTFHLMGQQAITGFDFDKEKAIPLAEHIKEEMKKIEDEVEPQLPPRPLKKSEENHYTFPAKPFKKDGTLSAHGLNFLERHGLELIGVDHIQWEGGLVKITGGKQLPATAKMTLGNQDDLKNWLLEEGWKPTLWNYKKDERGKPIKEKGKMIQTSPKMQENGKLCRNLEEMSGDLVKPLVKWLSYRNRLAVLENWVADERHANDGRLSAGSSGIAATHRQKHTKVVNVPKAEDGVLLGKEFRSLFIPRRDTGHVQVGFDASALEARVEAHYCYKFPGGDTYAYDLLEGDIHLKTAESVFGHKMKGIIGTPDFHKDHPLVKPWRSKSKNVKYACSYGAQPSKVASTIGVSEAEGKEVYDKFWQSAEPLAALKEALTTYWETTGEKKWIKGIDGRKLYSRSAHSLVNLLFQSCGAIIMDYAGIFLNKWLGDIQVDVDGTPGYLYKGHWVYRMTYMHDELQFSCPPEIADEVGTLGVSAIRKAGEFLKMRVPMEGEYIVGRNWAECH